MNINSFHHQVQVVLFNKKKVDLVDSKTVDAKVHWYQSCKVLSWAIGATFVGILGPMQCWTIDPKTWHQ